MWPYRFVIRWYFLKIVRSAKMYCYIYKKLLWKLQEKRIPWQKKAYKSGVKYLMQHEDWLRDLKPNYLVSDPTCSAGAAGFHWPGCRCWEYLDSVGSPSNLQNTQSYGQLLPPTCIINKTVTVTILTVNDFELLNRFEWMPPLYCQHLLKNLLWLA